MAESFWLMLEGASDWASRCARYCWTVARWKAGEPWAAHQAKKSSSARAYMARVSGLETAFSTNCRAGSKGLRRTRAWVIAFDNRHYNTLFQGHFRSHREYLLET